MRSHRPDVEQIPANSVNEWSAERGCSAERAPSAGVGQNLYEVEVSTAMPPREVQSRIRRAGAECGKLDTKPFQERKCAQHAAQEGASRILRAGAERGCWTPGTSREGNGSSMPPKGVESRIRRAGAEQDPRRALSPYFSESLLHFASQDGSSPSALKGPIVPGGFAMPGPAEYKK